MKTPARLTRPIFALALAGVLGGAAGCKKTPKPPAPDTEPATQAQKAPQPQPQPRPASETKALADVPPIPSLGPSDNKERPGTYFVQSGIEQYDFWVRIPDSYSTRNPAGLLLFLHGHGKPNPEPHGKTYQAQLWDKSLCDRFNLICIHATFGDGMQSDDLQRKVMAAKWAIAQVRADYKVIDGRGILAAFSNGGRPAIELVHHMGIRVGGTVPGPQYPFSLITMWSTVIRPRRQQVPHIPNVAFYMYAGEDEWPFSLVGVDGFRLYSDLWKRSEATVLQDIDFTVLEDIDHQMPDENLIGWVAYAFDRADTFYTPFVYGPDFAGGALDRAVQSATQLRLGDAYHDIESIKQSYADNTDVMARVARLENLLTQRTDKVWAQLKRLAQDDPALALNIFDVALSSQYLRHPEYATMSSFITRLRRQQEIKNVSEATNRWHNDAQLLIDDTPRVRPDQRAAVEKLAAQMPQTSVAGRNVRAFLALQEGRLGTASTPGAVDIPMLKGIKVDGGADDWQTVSPLPARLEGIAESHLRMAWTNESLLGIATVPEDVVDANGEDNLQIFIEKDLARGYYLHAQAAEYVFAPGTKEGVDQCQLKRVSPLSNRQTTEGMKCAWRKTTGGYTLEFAISQNELRPLALTDRSAMGFQFAINSNGDPIQQFYADKSQDRANETPKLWGVLRLGASRSTTGVGRF